MEVVYKNSDRGIYDAHECALDNPQILLEIKGLERESVNNEDALREFYEKIKGDYKNE